MFGLWGKKEETNVVQDNGFHMVEVHAPTMGLSVVAILIILAILALGHRCATTMRKRYLRRPRYYQATALQPMPPRRTYPIFDHEHYPYFNLDMRRQTPPGSIHEIPMERMAGPSRPRQHRDHADDAGGEHRESHNTAVATNSR